MAIEADTVIVEIRGMDRLEAAIDKFVQALNDFGRMAERVEPEIRIVVEAMDGISLEEASDVFLATGSRHDGLDDPAGEAQVWSAAALRDGETVHIPRSPSRPISDDEPLTAPPFFGRENR